MAEAIWGEESFGNGVVVRVFYDDATNRFLRVETTNPNATACEFFISRQDGVTDKLTVPIPPGVTTWDIPPGNKNRYHALNDVRFGVRC